MHTDDDIDINDDHLHRNFPTGDSSSISTGSHRNRTRPYGNNNRRFRRKSWRTKFLFALYESFSAAQAWIVLTIIGCVLGSLAGSVNIITEWLSDLRTGHCTLGIYLNRDFCCPGEEICPQWKSWTGYVVTDYFSYILFSVIFAFTSAYLVKFYAPYAAGSGISEIKCIIAGFVMKGFLEFPTLAIKSLTLPLTIASGLSVGKEGPSVHYAVCVGNVIGNMFAKYRNSSKRREILSACTAAGVAVAFGSPMGGVLFSIEEVSSTFQIKTMWRSYFCALVSTAVLAGVNAFRTGQIVLFSVSYDYDWHFFEIPFFIILGLFGGGFGIFLSKWNLRAQGFRKKYLAKYAIQEVVTLAFFTSVICYFNVFLKLDMTESMQLLFRECGNGHEDHILCDSSRRTHVVLSLLFAIVIRTFLVIISYGAKVPAGIFVPSMAIGAIFGRIVGTLVEALHDASTKGSSSFFATCPPDGPCITPGTYAFLGAAAALSGVLHITVTVVVIMYELTGALNYIVPTMIVVGITQAVGDRWGKGGLTDQAIWFNGFPFIDTKEVHRFNAPVSKAMSRKLIVLTAKDMTLDQVEKILDETDHRGFPIIESPSSKYLLGYIGRSELQYVINTQRAQGNLSPNAKCYFAQVLTDSSGNVISTPTSGSASGSSSGSASNPTSGHLTERPFALSDPPRSKFKTENGSDTNTKPLSSSSSSSRPGSTIFSVDDNNDENTPTTSTINNNSNINHNHKSQNNSKTSIDFEKFVNFTPITVRPQVALETVMEIFSQLGPGVVLVDYQGKLCGLMSRKDILRYQFQVEHIYAPKERELDRTAAELLDQKIWMAIVNVFQLSYKIAQKILPNKILSALLQQTGIPPPGSGSGSSSGSGSGALQSNLPQRINSSSGLLGEDDENEIDNDGVPLWEPEHQRFSSSSSSNSNQQQQGSFPL